jgi:SAM-dependent methyltransferase
MEGGSGTSSRAVPWALYAGFLLTTCSMLLVQQFLTRAFSIQFNSGLAFLAISTTFLGLGSAGVALAAFPRWFDAARIARMLPWLAVAYAASLVVGFGLEVAVDRAMQQSAQGHESLASQVQRVMTGSLFLLPSMFLVGLVIALVLRANSDRVGKLYGADLVGGGLGCLFVLPLMDVVGGDQGIFAIGALAALGAFLLAHAHGGKGSRRAAAALVAVVGAAPFANADLSLVDLQSHRTVLGGVDDWVLDDVELDRDWNAISRLGFFPTKGDGQIYVRIDSSCQTTIPSKDPERTKEYVARTNFERLPFVLDRHRRCLEIGAGGGRGMLLAKELGAERVTGVEINPGIVDAALGRFRGYGMDDIVRDPRFSLLIGEGRSHVRGADETYDSLTITFIQTGVASGSAAFALSEANLFTVEAFGEFLGKLDPDGVFYVYRHGGIECLRLVSMVREALARLSVADWRAHLYIARNALNECMVLVGRSPLRPEELQKLDAACAELSLEVVFAPGSTRGAAGENGFCAEVASMRERGELTMRAAVDAWKRTAHEKGKEPVEAAYIRSDNPDRFRDEFLVDIAAPTDDRPYFFFAGLNRLSDFGLYLDPAGTGLLGGTVVMLFWMGFGFAALIAALIVLPLLLRRRDSQGAPRRGGATVVAYFSALGVGYIAVQISFIQRFTMFLGHPVYAVSVVLLAFLLSSGAGSVVSDRLFRSGTLGFGRLSLGLAALLLLYNVALPPLFASSALAWPVAAKIALSIALIAVLAFPMGMFFPQGIRLVERISSDHVPWAWGANSAASVIGSIVALILAIHAGFAAVAAVGALVYVLVAWPAARAMARAAR